MKQNAKYKKIRRDKKKNLESESFELNIPQQFLFIFII